VGTLAGEVCVSYLVVIQGVDAFTKLGFHYLRVQGEHVDHREDLEQQSLLLVYIARSLESQILLLLFTLADVLLVELEGNSLPTLRQVVAVEHQQVRVLQVQLDRSYVLYHQHILAGVELDHALVTASLILLFQTLSPQPQTSHRPLFKIKLHPFQGSLYPFETILRERLKGAFIDKDASCILPRLHRVAFETTKDVFF
jgi:hypothetical protein